MEKSREIWKEKLLISRRTVIWYQNIIKNGKKKDTINREAIEPFQNICLQFWLLTWGSNLIFFFAFHLLFFFIFFESRCFEPYANVLNVFNITAPSQTVLSRRTRLTEAIYFQYHLCYRQHQFRTLQVIDQQFGSVRSVSDVLCDSFLYKTVFEDKV